MSMWRGWIGKRSSRIFASRRNSTAALQANTSRLRGNRMQGGHLPTLNRDMTQLPSGEVLARTLYFCKPMPINNYMHSLKQVMVTRLWAIIYISFFCVSVVLKQPWISTRNYTRWFRATSRWTCHVIDETTFIHGPAPCGISTTAAA